MFFPREKDTLLFVREYKLGMSVLKSVWASRKDLEFGVKERAFWAEYDRVKVSTQPSRGGWALNVQTREGNIMLLLPGG